MDKTSTIEETNIENQNNNTTAKNMNTTKSITNKNAKALKPHLVIYWI